jgi:hypothetical protein
MFALRVVERIPPDIHMVQFDPAGGTRIGGGALSQAVPHGGSAIAPYVYRDGFIFNGWSRSYANVTHDIVVRALWKNADSVTVVPPIGTVIMEGHFVDGDVFTQYSHMPMIYYIEAHGAQLESVKVDDDLLTPRTQFVATAGTQDGTVAIHLKASYLNSLTVGTHTLRVNFRHGVYSNAQLTVAAYTNPFYDVARNDWFFEGVQAMNASGLLQGISGTQFGPQTHMSRGMVVTLLYRFSGEPGVAGFRNPFPDVAPRQYYTDAVVWAAANGIVTGHPSGLFAPHDEMTHEQFAAVLYRYQNALGSVPRDILMDREYNDFNQINSYARAAVTS